MAVEIERKFLVLNDKLPPLEGGKRLVQGYLKAGSPQVRFRIIDDDVTLTLKAPREDGTRFEFELVRNKVSTEEQAALQEFAIYPLIEKVRYEIPFAELVWELDVYQGANLGLITVDVEMPALDYPLIFPSWVDAKADITRDPSYFNTNLALYPYSEWAETHADL